MRTGYMVQVVAAHQLHDKQRLPPTALNEEFSGGATSAHSNMKHNTKVADGMQPNTPPLCRQGPKDQHWP